MFYTGGSKILHKFYWNKDVCHCCRSHWFWWKLALLHTALEQLRYYNLCYVSVQDSRGCSIYEHAVVLFFFSWQLAPAGLLCDLVTVDADWHRLKLLTDSRRTSLEKQTQICNWLRQLPHSTQVVHCLHAVHCGLQLMHQQWENSCILSSRLMMTPYARNASYEISRNLQSEQHWHFECRYRRLYLLQTQNYQRMHILFEYSLKMGAEGMFCSSKLPVK